MATRSERVNSRVDQWKVKGHEPIQAIDGVSYKRYSYYERRLQALQVVNERLHCNGH